MLVSTYVRFKPQSCNLILKSVVFILSLGEMQHSVKFRRTFRQKKICLKNAKCYNSWPPKAVRAGVIFKSILLNCELLMGFMKPPNFIIKILFLNKMEFINCCCRCKCRCLHAHICVYLWATEKAGVTEWTY